jgi:hypothetical protein
MYGDPAANVKFYDFGDSAKEYKENFSSAPNSQGTTTFEYSITPTAFPLEFGKGYCYAFRPVYFMPVRIDPATVSITKNEGDTADITDNLILWELLSTGKTLAKGATKTLRFTAKLMNGTAVVPQEASRVLPRAMAQASMTPDNKRLLVNFQNIPAGEMVMTIVNATGKRLYFAKTMSSGEQQQSRLLPVKASPGVNFLLLRHERMSVRTKIAAME